MSLRVKAEKKVVEEHADILDVHARFNLLETPTEKFRYDHKLGWHQWRWMQLFFDCHIAESRKIFYATRYTETIRCDTECAFEIQHKEIKILPMLKNISDLSIALLRLLPDCESIMDVLRLMMKNIDPLYKNYITRFHEDFKQLKIMDGYPDKANSVTTLRMLLNRLHKGGFYDMDSVLMMPVDCCNRVLLLVRELLTDHFHRANHFAELTGWLASLAWVEQAYNNAVAVHRVYHRRSIGKGGNTKRQVDNVRYNLANMADVPVWESKLLQQTGINVNQRFVNVELEYKSKLEQCTQMAWQQLCNSVQLRELIRHLNPQKFIDHSHLFLAKIKKTAYFTFAFDEVFVLYERELFRFKWYFEKYVRLQEELSEEDRSKFAPQFERVAVDLGEKDVTGEEAVEFVNNVLRHPINQIAAYLTFLNAPLTKHSKWFRRRRASMMRRLENLSERLKAIDDKTPAAIHAAPAISEEPKLSIDLTKQYDKVKKLYQSGIQQLNKTEKETPLKEKGRPRNWSNHSIRQELRNFEERHLDTLKKIVDAIEYMRSVGNNTLDMMIVEAQKMIDISQDMYDSFDNRETVVIFRKFLEEPVKTIYSTYRKLYSAFQRDLEVLADNPEWKNLTEEWEIKTGTSPEGVFGAPFRRFHEYIGFLTQADSIVMKKLKGIPEAYKKLKNKLGCSLELTPLENYKTRHTDPSHPVIPADEENYAFDHDDSADSRPQSPHAEQLETEENRREAAEREAALRMDVDEEEEREVLEPAKGHELVDEDAIDNGVEEATESMEADGTANVMEDPEPENPTQEEIRADGPNGEEEIPPQNEELRQVEEVEIPENAQKEEEENRRMKNMKPHRKERAGAPEREEEAEAKENVEVEDAPARILEEAPNVEEEAQPVEEKLHLEEDGEEKRGQILAEALNVEEEAQPVEEMLHLEEDGEEKNSQILAEALNVEEEAQPVEEKLHLEEDGEEKNSQILAEALNVEEEAQPVEEKLHLEEDGEEKNSQILAEALNVEEEAQPVEEKLHLEEDGEEKSPFVAGGPLGWMSEYISNLEERGSTTKNPFEAGEEFGWLSQYLSSVKEEARPVGRLKEDRRLAEHGGGLERVLVQPPLLARNSKDAVEEAVPVDAMEEEDVGDVERNHPLPLKAKRGRKKRAALEGGDEQARISEDAQYVEEDGHPVEAIEKEASREEDVGEVERGLILPPGAKRARKIKIPYEAGEPLPRTSEDAPRDEEEARAVDTKPKAPFEDGETHAAIPADAPNGEEEAMEHELFEAEHGGELERLVAQAQRAKRGTKPNARVEDGYAPEAQEDAPNCEDVARPMDGIEEEIRRPAHGGELETHVDQAPRAKPGRKRKVRVEDGDAPNGDEGAPPAKRGRKEKEAPARAVDTMEEEMIADEYLRDINDEVPESQQPSEQQKATVPRRGRPKKKHPNLLQQPSDCERDEEEDEDDKPVPKNAPRRGRPKKGLHKNVQPSSDSEQDQEEENSVPKNAPRRGRPKKGLHKNVQPSSDSEQDQEEENSVPKNAPRRGRPKKGLHKNVQPSSDSEQDQEEENSVPKNAPRRGRPKKGKPVPKNPPRQLTMKTQLNKLTVGIYIKKAIEASPDMQASQKGRVITKKVIHDL